MADHVIDPQYPHLGGNLAGGDPYTFYPNLWKWFVERLKVRRVLDIGCGEGYTVSAFAELGCAVVGIDGLPRNTDKCKNAVIVHDLTQGPWRWAFADLVWCCEVVEHIEPKYLDNLMTTLCQGKYVAITHALPRQRGYHHVNCQPAQYWIDAFAQREYRFDEALTEEAKSERLVPNPDYHWRKSGMIFVSP